MLPVDKHKIFDQETYFLTECTLKWIDGNEQSAEFILGGSATPSLSIQDLISLSSHPSATEGALQFQSLKLGLGSSQGAAELRSNIASLYDESKGISSKHVITATGTTGANQTVFQTLIRAGDHVVCQYPIYPQLRDLPKAFPCEVSLWKLDPENGWKGDLEQLRQLIRPNTKMIILNNPNNPTGSHLDAVAQGKIIDIAREHNIIVFADEIFRPLYHHGPAGEKQPTPPSLVEHDYTRVVVTSSLSKVWGMSGARVGWIVCRDQSLLDAFVNARQYTFQATSSIDEVIATEALHPARCRPATLQRHLAYARQNLALLDAFVARNSDMCSWTRPTSGATAFLKFRSATTGEAFDDVEFCRALLRDKRVLLSPGSLCFSDSDDHDGRVAFKGYTRVHFTCLPDTLQKALELVDAFLAERRRAPN